MRDSFSYYYDDNAAHKGNRTLLFVLLAVLALGIIGIIYLFVHSPSKRAAGGNISVTITPEQTQVAAGEAHDFAASVTGTGDTDITWSVQEGSAAGKIVPRGAQAQGGTLANMSVYIAPQSPGTYHLIAASKADPSRKATAEITVTPH